MRANGGPGWLGYALVAAAVLVVLGPVMAPLLEVLRYPQAWQAWGEWHRLAVLLRNSVLLAAGAVALALPLGATAGFLLARTDVPFRGPLIAGLVLVLVIPVPLITSGWLLAWPALTRLSNTPLDGPLRMLGAIWLHALAGLPWVALVTGLGFLMVEPELEEDALLAAPARQVAWAVTIPRARMALVVAAVQVGWMTWTEISITDLFRVRTFAEEVYTQFSSSPVETAAALVVALPGVAAMMLLVLGAFRWWRQLTPPRLLFLAGPRRFALGPWRWPALALVVALLVLLLGVPLAGMIVKAGTRFPTTPGEPESWSLPMLGQRVLEQARRLGPYVWTSVGIAACTGTLTAGGALALAWTMRVGGRAVEAGTWLLLALLLALPGPILGIGLLDWILTLGSCPGGGLVLEVAYRHPSWLPNVWAGLLRFLPFAVLALWPLVRMLPQGLDEAARLDGAGPWLRFRLIVWTHLRAATDWVGVGVALMSFGELSVSKLVATPGTMTLAEHVFLQLHAGADVDLAAGALLMLGAVALGWCMAAGVGWQGSRRGAVVVPARPGP